MAHEALPPEADVDQVKKVKLACAWDKVRLGGSAEFHVNYWKIGATGLRNALNKHIEEKRKVFRKLDPKAPDTLLANNLQANVSIYDGKDVYVEMILTEKVFIIVNAHEHTTQTRLPQ